MSLTCLTLKVPLSIWHWVKRLFFFLFCSLVKWMRKLQEQHENLWNLHFTYQIFLKLDLIDTPYQSLFPCVTWGWTLRPSLLLLRSSEENPLLSQCLRLFHEYVSFTYFLLLVLSTSCYFHLLLYLDMMFQGIRFGPSYYCRREDRGRKLCDWFNATT